MQSFAAAKVKHAPTLDLEKKGNPADSGYLVVLVNCSSHVVQYVCTSDHLPSPNEQLNWMKVSPPIGRTCDTNDFQTCINEGKYTPLLNENCTFSGFVGVAWQEPDGQWLAVFTNKITADCEHYSGTAVQLLE